MPTLNRTSVRLNSKFQVVIPKHARAALNLAVGDELLVLVKEDRIVMFPRPKSFTARLANLAKEIWTDSEGYLKHERDSW